MAKMTPNDLFTLKMVFTEPVMKIKQNTLSFLKFIIVFDLERKSEFHGNIATYRYTLYRLEPYRT